MPDVVWRSQADYARHRGVTPKAIEKAITARRIPAEAVRYDGRSKLIDVAAADLAWPLSTVRVNTPPEFSDSSSTVPGEIADAPREAPALVKARTESAQIDARSKDLALRKALGEVRDVADVNRSMEIAAIALARDLDQLAARADDLATAFTRNGIDGLRALLKQIGREIRATMANNMRLLEADETADEAADEFTEDAAA